jgi:vancomycin aglycone glucosyltransferase
LFPRVAAIVHHGGAGTAHAAARAGKPQVVVPHMFDQFYHALRVQQLGIGVSCPPRHQLNADVMTQALHQCSQSDVKASAQSLANRMVKDAAKAAAGQLSQELA